MSRQGQWDRGDCIFEANTVVGERIDIRGGIVRKAITAKIIGPAGVDAYQDDMADVIGDNFCLLRIWLRISGRCTSNTRMPYYIVASCV